MTELNKALSKKYLTKDDLISIVNGTPYPVVVTTYDYRNPVIVFANTEHEALTGYESNSVIGMNPRTFQGDGTSREVIESLKCGLRDFDSWDGVLTNYTKSGKRYNVYIVIFGVSIDSGEKFYVAVKRGVS